MGHRFFPLVVMLAFLAACSPGKKVIEHPAPQLKMDNSYFESLGCFDNTACLPEELQKLDRPIDSIHKPSDLLGGLSPALPLAIATTRGFTPEEEIPAVYAKRCLTQQYIRYLVNVNDTIRLVDSTGELALIFAPIDSTNEALSYAMASTGLTALFDLEETRKIKLYSDHAEETFVEDNEGEYRVHLFNTYLCGCGPHIISGVEVLVQKDGSIQVGDPIQVFSDPAMDDLCID